MGLRTINEYKLSYDPQIMHASHIYNAAGRKALSEIYGQYLQVAEDFSLPILLMSNTRRVSKDRIMNSPYKDKNVIKDYVDFLKEIASKYNCETHIGGYMGCKGDGYTGENCLSCADAVDFHSWQVEKFAQTDVDFLLVSLMPTTEETIGIASLIEQTSLSYIVSFMIRESGHIPDGHTVHEAIAAVDDATIKKPLCYMTNCIHPKILRNALHESNSDLVKNRFKGIMANAAYLPPEKLDKLSETISSNAETLADEIVRLNKDFGLKICGGCCGTDASHIRELAKQLRK